MILRQQPNMGGTGGRRSLSFTRGGTLQPRTPAQQGAPAEMPAPAAVPAPVTPPSAGVDPANPAQQGMPRDPRERGPNGIDPVDVQVGPSTLGSFQEHQDAAYQQATRTLDPMWEANQRRFDQDMINRGITPGSQAYDLARAQFDRGRNDAYSSAQNQAMEAGQRAQQQAFQQAYMESELANQLLRQREGNQTSIDVAGVGAGASMYGNDINRQNFMDQLGFNQQQFQDDQNRWNLGFERSGDQWNQNFAREGNQWDRQFGLGQQNSDFNQMMQLMGFDRDTTNMQNQQGNQQFAQLMSLFGMVPQAQGASPVDYMGALGMNQNQQNANYQTGVNSANQNNAQYAAILASLFCDENAKDIGAPVDKERCLEITKGLPLVHFTYKGSEIPCVGTLAQAFNTALHGTPDTQIKVIDLLGVLVGAMQALDAKYQAQSEELARLRAA